VTEVRDQKSEISKTLALRPLLLALSLLSSLLLAPCSAVEAQRPGKVPRIAWLTNTPLSANPDRREAFRQGLHELGYVEGKGIIVEWRSTEGKFERIAALAAE
jgi:putative ABC transport system substrate-binding protein